MNRELLTTGWRAFLIVTITATNVSMIARGHYLMAFCTGGALSWVWWGNTRTAVRSDVRGAQVAYALGAAAGTVAGMTLGRLLG